jgi:hypothetical protein
MSAQTQKQSIHDKWQEIAAQMREEAALAPPGSARDALLDKARHLDTACHINEWVSSPGLRAPVEVNSLRK